MDIAGTIISRMSKDEARFFKLYMTRMETGERKDLLLFDYIRKNGASYNDDLIFTKLYGKGDKNAYYRLRNRLMTGLNKSLLLQHWDEDDLLQLFQLYSLSGFYAARNELRLAVYFLRKSESKAVKSERYGLLDLIYSEFIRLSGEIPGINPEDYINKRRENQEKITQLRAIDDVVAVLAYRLKYTQNFAKGDQSVISLLEDTVNDYSNDPGLRNSPLFRMRSYAAISQILLQKRDYAALESFLLKTFKDFTKKGFFNKNNHDTQLQMLTYIVNSLFKNNKLRESLKYTELLHNAMEEYNKVLYDKYLFFYYNSLVINYSKLDKHKAISILEQLLEQKKLTGNPFYEIFIYLNLAVLHFDLHSFRESIRYISRLYLLDSYKNADEALQLKIAVSELIVRYELRDLDYLDYRTGRLRKDFRALLKTDEFLKEKDFLTVLTIMANSTGDLKEKQIRKKITTFIDSYTKAEESDNEILNYSAWLKDKI
ncbi:MAG TPA: hypothetical protein VFW78_14115 [Bacteroidia bacterium]|nr:hypothetical protein [Bacteroidia bacterium]